MKKLTRLKLARLVTGYSQQELAEKLGVTPGAVSQWEIGATAPSLRHLKPLAEFLNLSVEEILDCVKEAG